MENFEPNLYVSNKNELQEDDHTQVTADLNKYLENLYRKAKENSIPIEESLGTGSLEKMNTLYELVKKQFQKRGIENVVLPPTLFMKDIKEKAGGVVLGTSFPTHIEMYPYDIENESLRQLEVFKTLSHELYHSIGRNSWQVSDVNLLVRNVDQKTLGASNMGKGEKNTKEHGFAFEEGLAVQFEAALFEEIKTLFPADVIEKHKAILEGKATQLKIDNNLRLDEDMTDIHIQKYHDSGEEMVIFNNNYHYSKKLVDFLEANIPDFQALLEDARINGKIIGLGKAIDTVLGSGFYRRIATATTDKSLSLLIGCETALLQKNKSAL